MTWSDEQIERAAANARGAYYGSLHASMRSFDAIDPSMREDWIRVARAILAALSETHVVVPRSVAVDLNDELCAHMGCVMTGTEGENQRYRVYLEALRAEFQRLGGAG